ncbi:MAG: dihydroorotase [gamma proteobacterium symbiont of Ctena orbiculata]
MKKKKDISILGGRVIDPANGLDEIIDLHISGGKILALGEPPNGFQASLAIDARDQVVCPGLIDLSANLREPGAEHKATIASETLAAAGSGITTICCTPDTYPVIDTPAVVGQIRHKARKAGYCRLLPQGALTQALNGDRLSEMAALKAAGCIAVTNVYTPLANTLVQRRAMEYASTFELLIILRPEDHHLSNDGCAHEGKVADRLGLPGIPEAAETVAVARDLALAETTGAVIHFHALSSASAARTMAWAKREGRRVSADVAIHQLHLSEMDIEGFDSNHHVRPPLRSDNDREGLRDAVAKDVIQAICSDHQPHEADAKASPFPDTEAGISGLETLLPLTLKLVDQGVLDLSSAIARLTSGPADILGLPLGRLTPKHPADICIFDPNQRWVVDTERLLSGGKNTPFAGWEMPARVTHTLLKGRLVYSQNSYEKDAP